jgi:hypothetical protein
MGKVVSFLNLQNETWRKLHINKPANRSEVFGDIVLDKCPANICIESCKHSHHSKHFWIVKKRRKQRCDQIRKTE